MTIEKHEQVFLLGDLNFRIDAMNREQVLSKINGNRFDEILREDDLIKAFDLYNNTPKQMQNKYQDMLFS